VVEEAIAQYKKRGAGSTCIEPKYFFDLSRENPRWSKVERERFLDTVHLGVRSIMSYGHLF
jgi:hypothetical protein